jgi:KDO2-lipid IV(A) lauroyltransferase
MRGREWDVKPGLGHYLEYYALVMLDRVVSRVSPPVLQRLGTSLGWFACHFIPVRRSVAREHIRMAFPGLPDREAEKILLDSYASLCTTALEVLRMRSLDGKALLDMVEVDGREHFDRALEEGKGLIVVTYHLGNWELMGAVTSLLGYPLDVIYQHQSNPLSDRFINRIRTKFGTGIIERSQAVTQSIRALKKNRIVAFLSDQDAHREGVFAPLFGRPASTPRGPAMLHLRLKTPIVTGVGLRNPDGSHRFLIRPLDVEASGNTENDVYAILSECNRRLEEYVRAHPGQWLWQHRRWKTRPQHEPLQLQESSVGPA